MTEHLLVTTASILVLGIAAQWLAWRLRLPSILLLLIFGFVAGPITGFLDPDHLFGDLLFPIVSLAVAVILFEGGLSLKFAELRAMGVVLRNLITLGALVTWVVSVAAAYFVVGLDFELAVLFGAILIVTGPTVIGPLLRFVRPAGQTSPILKWEGIVIDPIGAVLAVLVFETIQASHIDEATAAIAFGLVKTILIGIVVGVSSAGLLMIAFRRHWIPDHLHNAAALMLVVSAFALSNAFQEESGLLTVTVMGVVLANQRWVSIKHIVEFKENLRVLFISGLFIILSARLQLADLAQVGLGSLAFLTILILIARPLAVVVSTLGSDLKWGERAFLAWMAPRGIVAAAVSSVFALRLTEEGFTQARLLVPLTFVVIVGTVTIYGLTALPIARWLGVVKAKPQGLLIAGAHGWARAIARTLNECGLATLLVDTNPAHIAAAHAEGLHAQHHSILSEEFQEEVDLTGIGRLLALTSNDEVNSLAALHFAEVFGRTEIYQLSAQTYDKSYWTTIPRHLRGRALFRPEVTGAYLEERFNAGARVQAFPVNGARETVNGANDIPLFLMSETGDLRVFTVDTAPTPRPGQTLIKLVDPDTQG